MSCPDCFQGHVHEGEPRGRVTKLYGLDTYVTEPSDGRQIKGIIIIIPDGFGWVFANNRLLADHYADKGNYKVYLPDFMNGYSAPAWLLDTLRSLTGPGNYLYKPYHLFNTLWGFIPWALSNRIGKSGPRVTSFLEQLQQSEEDGALPVGAAGFCWGGKHVVLLAEGRKGATGRPLIGAGFTGHPSMLNIPGEIEQMTLPVSFAVGDKDATLPLASCEKIKAIVEAKPAEARGEVRIYHNCSHGFCVRADMTFKDDEVAQQALEAEDQCIAWFNARLNIAS